MFFCAPSPGKISFFTGRDSRFVEGLGVTLLSFSNFPFVASFCC